MVLFTYSHSESLSEKHSIYNATGKVMNELFNYLKISCLSSSFLTFLVHFCITYDLLKLFLL